MNEHAPLHMATDVATSADDAPGGGDTASAAGAMAAALPRIALAGDQLDVWNALVRLQASS